VHALRWLLLYFPVTFLLEEVFFRGMLDSWMHRPGEPRARATAQLVAVLWALWHLPVVPWTGPGTIVSLLLVHVTLGIPFSLYWRRSGNLTGPAAAHALIDAVRNALLH
jgi:membrane protease YdiL (CAAX protease family)